MRSVQANPTSGKVCRPKFSGTNGRQPECKTFPKIRELFGYWSRPEPREKELLPNELKAIIAGIGKREDFEELMWAIESIRHLFCMDILQAEGADKESADYQAAYRCFQAFNEFIGVVSSYDTINGKEGPHKHKPKQANL